MLSHHTPPGIHPPFAAYSHGVVVPPGARWMVCSGQLGIGVDGAVPDDAGEQARLCFETIRVILAEAGMALTDIVRINAFVSDREYLKPYMAVRDRFVGNPPPASTLMVVSGFARPEFKVEVEVIAAKVD
ncbi:enamine deaminase RidA (YjgF/YER057c/UK114 family) [Tepidamorphus gemmatus]|uniref:Enamine deaminase RidA (YjgF/YER057c/UK114 family) n=1 Tax=Tepidamorphus gemmatus TaxID=747076 RepID=A0A4R3M703_9HYPH|nr:RidA family protein [Tepidamorphus gemmatus]TCT09221.1 enamine deaminase RidA (YjgF/YER057c/UK114 family) [Tepidamorphus gemmatus]